MAPVNANNVLNVQQIEPEVRYWFVRSETGQYFEPFINGSFIGIGWDGITLADIRNQTELEIRSKIARIERVDDTTPSGRRKVTSIHNKIKNFVNLAVNDIVIVPTRNSDHLAFGRVTEAQPYNAQPNEAGYEHTKRRRVEWLIEPQSINLLDPTFYKIKQKRIAISNVSEFADQIDSVLYNVYQKGDFSHYVLHVNAQQDVNWGALAGLLNDLHLLMEEVNITLGLNEDTRNSTIKINLQSPGRFNLKQFGISLLLAASLLGAAGCDGLRQNLTPQQSAALDTVSQRNSQRIQNAQQELGTLHIRP
jgi:restriction system protein